MNENAFGIVNVRNAIEIFMISIACELEVVDRKKIPLRPLFRFV
jgi:hypothetical protein